MKRTAVAALLLLVGATGCGGGSEDKVADSGPSSSPSVSLPTGFPEGLGEKCAGAATALGKAGAAIGAGAGGASDFATTARQVAEVMKSIEDDVPSGEVRDAVKTLATAYESLGEALKDVKVTPGQAPPTEYLSALQSISDPRFTAAASTLSTYFAGGCKG